MAAWAKIKLFWDTMLGHSGSSFTVTNTATGDYDKAYIHNMLEVNSWKAADTTDQDIQYDGGDPALNGDFETGSLTPWQGWTNGAGAATFTIGTTAPYEGTYDAVIDVTNGGGGYGDVHFAHSSTLLSVKKGETYKFSFAARANANRDIQVRIVDHASTTTDLTNEGVQTVSITTSDVVYSVTFTISADDDAARFDFLLGNVISTVHLDRIKMERVFGADYIAILGHNLKTAGASVVLQYSTDNFAGDINTIFTEAPFADSIFLKEFTNPGKFRYWRARLTGASTAVEAAILIWGLKTELDYASASFDPYGQTARANVNVTQGGLVSGIHQKFIERDMMLHFADADAALYTKVKDWRDGSGMKNFFVAWETANNPNDVYLMRPDPRFNNPLTNGGLYRDITLSLKGRKA